MKVGVPLPWSVTRAAAGERSAAGARADRSARPQLRDEEALEAGLADELADAEGFEDCCRARLEEFADKDAQALATTKALAARRRRCASMKAGERERLDGFLDGWFSPGTRERVQATVASLKAKG